MAMIRAVIFQGWLQQQARREREKSVSCLPLVNGYGSAISSTPHRKTSMGFFAFLTIPPGPAFPEQLYLKKMCAIVWCYTGPLEDAGQVCKPVRTPVPAGAGFQRFSYTSGPSWGNVYRRRTFRKAGFTVDDSPRLWKARGRINPAVYLHCFELSGLENAQHSKTKLNSSRFQP